MANGLTQWLKTGYGHLEPCLGLTEWFLPQQTFDSVVDELGYHELMRLTALLEFAEDVELYLAQAPDPQTVSAEAWENAIKSWRPLSQVRSQIQSLQEVSDRILAEFHKGGLRAEPFVVCRGLATLFMAPFLPQGQWLLPRLAIVMGSSPYERAALLIDRYVEVVISGDQDMLGKINCCIIEGAPVFEKWSVAVMESVARFPFILRMNAVTPPLSAEFEADILVQEFCRIIAGIVFRLLRKQDGAG